MTDVGERLKHARLQQGKSLQDIADATRINKKFLEELEDGKPLSFPETYVRAFIRAYAAQVGVPASELRVDTVSNPELVATISRQERPGTPLDAPRAPSPAGPPAPSSRQRLIMTSLAITIVLALVASILWLRKDQHETPVQEISFAEAVREQEDRVADPLLSPAAAPDSATRDSLFLEATAAERVWVRIVTDSSAAQEYTLTPLFKKQWKAKELFMISIGNGGAVSFRLNGLTLGALGKVGKPMWNLLISRAALDTLRLKNSPKLP